MMIIGNGIDIIEIERVAGLIQRQPRIIHRLLTDREQTVMPAGSPRRLAEFVAGRFAAKEAVVKALGTGIGSAVSLLDIEIIAAPSGRPEIFLSPRAKERFPHSERWCFHLSISHSREFAVAHVVIEQV